MGLKKGDARRGELLAASEKLFYTKGYENTSVQDILDALELSKGGFYHYFVSKEAVLQEICEQRATARFGRLGALPKRDDGRRSAQSDRERKAQHPARVLDALAER